MFHFKKIDMTLILATTPKVKLMVPVHRSLKILQQLSETLFPKMLSFRDISLSRNFLYTLYVCMYVCVYIYIYIYIHRVGHFNLTTQITHWE